jgi:hypothetical protein
VIKGKAGITMAKDRQPPLFSRQLAATRFATALTLVGVAASAFGAMAIGALAIGRLKLDRGKIEHLAIEDLEVGRLRVRELIVENQ